MPMYKKSDPIGLLKVNTMLASKETFDKIRDNLDSLNESREEFPEVLLRDDLCKLSEEFLSYEGRDLKPKEMDQLDQLAEQILEMTNAIVLEIEQQQATRSLEGLRKMFSISDMLDTVKKQKAE